MTNSNLYLDDLLVGQRFRSDCVRVTAEDIKSFARSFDPQAFHLDEVGAETTLFRGLAASGWHTAALTMKLLVGGTMPIAGGVIGLGAELSWPTPVRPDDQLLVECEIISISPSKSKSDRGTVVIRAETKNQQDAVVQALTAKLLVFRRPGIAEE